MTTPDTFICNRNSGSPGGYPTYDLGSYVGNSIVVESSNYPDGFDVHHCVFQVKTQQPGSKIRFEILDYQVSYSRTVLFCVSLPEILILEPTRIEIALLHCFACKS